jgi:hypothetical protein
MEFMVLTLATFQPERTELKVVAVENMEYMALTRETSHFERSELKAAAL